MAKIAKKKPDSSANPRSRAAKRATSPSIDIDKSIKDAPRASDASPMLGISQHSGVSKKKKKAKQITRGQRIRQEKGLARAEAVMDQMEKKVGGAKNRLKNRQQRKVEWNDINAVAAEEQRKATKAPGRMATKDKDTDRSLRDEADTDMNAAPVGVPPNNGSAVFDPGQNDNPDTTDETDLIT